MKCSEIENFFMTDRKFHNIVMKFWSKRPIYQNIMSKEDKADFILDYKMSLVDKINKIVSSNKIISQVGEFHRNQQNIQRYVNIAKRLANIPLDKRIILSQDPNLIGNPRDIDDTTAEEVMKDDARAFYYELDVMTGGKYKFLDKINKTLKTINFLNGVGRSNTCSYMDNGKLVFEINVDTSPWVTNRTVLMHELWHGIDEKNFNQREQCPKEQFIGEIGSMFVDRLSLDYMEKNHSDDQYVIGAMEDVKNADVDLIINNARDSYLDSLICRVVGGSEDSGKRALREIVDNIGNTWGMRSLNDKCNELLEIVNDPRLNYGPLYELRYVVGQAVVDKVYDLDIPMSEKVSKMADINNHILSIDKLNTSGAGNCMDIVTDYLGIPRIEACAEEMATKYEMDKNSARFKSQNNHASANADLARLLYQSRLK